MSWEKYTPVIVGNIIAGLAVYFIICWNERRKGNGNGKASY